MSVLCLFYRAPFKNASPPISFFVAERLAQRATGIYEAKSTSSPPE
jgi:hypothetical protein